MKGNYMVRAKFVVSYKSQPNDNGEGHVTLSPVYSGSEENKQFFAATPGGSIQLNVINPSAFAVFEHGKEFYVDFTEANS